jgi:transcriptional antiterminator NusG
MIYVYRVTAGQERVVAEMVSKKVAKEKLQILAVALFEDLKGYLLVEADDEVAVRQAALKIPHIKGVLNKPMEITEIESLIAAAKPAGMSLSKGDIIEIISGPFKGEKAKVSKIDQTKEELTVELTEVAVPIPVTIKANVVKLYQKAEDAG